MSSSKPYRRFALVAAQMLSSAALLVAATTAKADMKTYWIVDYPASQADMVFPGTDHVAGAITTDGVLGRLSLA